MRHWIEALEELRPPNRLDASCQLHPPSYRSRARERERERRMWQESRKGLSFNVPEEGDGPNGLTEDLGRPIYYSCFFLFSLVFSFFLNPTALSSCFVYWYGFASPYRFKNIGCSSDRQHSSDLLLMVSQAKLYAC